MRAFAYMLLTYPHPGPGLAGVTLTYLPLHDCAPFLAPTVPSYGVRNLRSPNSMMGPLENGPEQRWIAFLTTNPAFCPLEGPNFLGTPALCAASTRRLGRRTKQGSKHRLNRYMLHMQLKTVRLWSDVICRSLPYLLTPLRSPAARRVWLLTYPLPLSRQ